jgi:hypothetical protein
MIEFILDVLDSEMTEAKKKKVGLGVTITYRGLVLIGILYLVYDRIERRSFETNISGALTEIKIAQNRDSLNHAIEKYDHQRYEAHFERLDNGDQVIKSDISMIKGRIGLQ